MLRKIISGGQTGVDQAGLAVAKAFGLETGGWMPKGYKTKAGPRPEFAELYGMRETGSITYPPRTALNVKESDGTIRFARYWDSSGEQLTFKMINQYRKPSIDVDRVTRVATPEDVLAWIFQFQIQVLNVAGNAEDTSPGIYSFTEKFLWDLMTLIQKR